MYPRHKDARLIVLLRNQCISMLGNESAKQTQFDVPRVVCDPPHKPKSFKGFKSCIGETRRLPKLSSTMFDALEPHELAELARVQWNETMSMGLLEFPKKGKVRLPIVFLPPVGAFVFEFTIEFVHGPLEADFIEQVCLL